MFLKNMNNNKTKHVEKITIKLVIQVAIYQLIVKKIVISDASLVPLFCVPCY